MVSTELAPRWQQFHVAPAMQQPKSAVSTPLPWILKIRAIYNRIQSLVHNHIQRVQRVCSRAENSVCKESAREQRIALYIKAMNTVNNPSPRGSQVEQQNCFQLQRRGPWSRQRHSVSCCATPVPSWSSWMLAAVPTLPTLTSATPPASPCRRKFCLQGECGVQTPSTGLWPLSSDRCHNWLRLRSLESAIIGYNSSLETAQLIVR